MLDQLKSALETFATATQHAEYVIAHHQAQAEHNLAHFQEAHADVAASIKRDWEKMSDDLTKYTWSKYLGMFGGIANHYTNLTQHFTKLSDKAIAKQDEALKTAELVHGAMDHSITTTKDLAHQQKTLYELVSGNNAALLTSQDQLQARSEFLLSLMDVIHLTLTDEVEKLNVVVNSTNELRELLDESSPLLTLLTPLADGLRFAASFARALWHVDLLALSTVMANGGLGWTLGRKMIRRMQMSLFGSVGALVILRRGLL
jgi:hypothetical protein